VGARWDWSYDGRVFDFFSVKSKDFIEGVIAFVEKRPAKFTGS
jgi:enoyl-CoA hydratase/carnithine racemase